MRILYAMEIREPLSQRVCEHAKEHGMETKQSSLQVKANGSKASPVAASSTLVPDMVTMLEAGVHFGHERSKRNPKMDPFVTMYRNRIAVIDLEQTMKYCKAAIEFVIDVAKVPTNEILFVGTKWQARPIIQKYATLTSQPYVTKRWLGGTFTNFSTILKSIEKLGELKRAQENPKSATMTKKERAVQQKEVEHLEGVLEGIKNLKKLPAAIYVAGSNDERIAVREARRVGIPVIGIVDANADPDVVDYPIPGNDDAIRSLDLITGVIAKAILQARGKAIEIGESKTREDGIK